MAFSKIHVKQKSSQWLTPTVLVSVKWKVGTGRSGRGGGLLASQPSLEQSFSSVRNPDSHKTVKVPVVVSFANYTDQNHLRKGLNWELSRES